MWADDCDLAEAAALSPTVAARWRTIGELLDTYAYRQGLDPDELTAFAFVESRFSRTAVSNAGAQGIMQLLPVTGAAMARKLGIDPFDPFNPAHNIRAGARFIAALQHRFKGRPVEWARAAYFDGPGNVEKYGPSRTHARAYTDAIALALKAVRATRDRCEHGGGGTVPVWRKGATPRPQPQPRPSPRPSPRPGPRPAPSPNGGGVGGIAVLALVALAAVGLGRG